MEPESFYMFWGTFLGIFVTPIAKFLYEKFFKKGLVKHNKRATIDVVNIFEHVLHPPLQEATKINRVIILKAHDSGGLLSPRTEWKASVQFEDFVAGVKPAKEFFQKIRLDYPYVKMLYKLQNDYQVNIKPDEQMPEGMLGNIYKANGVKSTHIRLISSASKEIFYIAFDSDHEDCFDDPHTKFLVDSSVAYAKELYSKY